MLLHLENLLGKFQSDLGTVSDEIKQLQAESSTLGTKLRNRKAAEAKIGAFVERLTVSEELINAVFDVEVGDDYVPYLEQLGAKLEFLEHDSAGSVSQAKRDIEPLLRK